MYYLFTFYNLLGIPMRTLLSLIHTAHRARLEVKAENLPNSSVFTEMQQLTSVSHWEMNISGALLFSLLKAWLIYLSSLSLDQKLIIIVCPWILLRQARGTPPWNAICLKWFLLSRCLSCAQRFCIFFFKRIHCKYIQMKKERKPRKRIVL